MKKLISAICTLLILINLSCDKDDELNQQPYPAILVEPANGSVHTNQTISFNWESSYDPEGNHIVYYLYVSQDSNNWGTEKRTIIDETSCQLSGMQQGKIYYWKIKSENYFSENPPSQEATESFSTINHFYTSPPNITNLADSSANQFTRISWTDPDSLGFIEITFTPNIAAISQPIKINPGVEHIELNGLTNETKYSFFIRTCDLFNNYSIPDTISALPLPANKVHDIDYHIYDLITIGNQTWFKQNLAVSRYNNGNSFSRNVTEQDLSTSKSDTYGLYYYAYIAIGDDNKDQNICPKGYHVPTLSEWQILEKFLGMSDEDIAAKDFDFHGTDVNAGYKLKTALGWDTYQNNDGNGSDAYGFSALPAGNYNDSDEPETGTQTGFLTSTPAYTTNIEFCYAIMLSNQSTGIQLIQTGASNKLSIRCIKD